MQASLKLELVSLQITLLSALIREYQLKDRILVHLFIQICYENFIEKAGVVL
jgi:hypothetical protein